MDNLLNTVLLGDCLEIMEQIPEKSIHAVVTDPPYCSGGFSEAAKTQAKGQGLRSETIKEVGWFCNDSMTTGGLVWLLRRMSNEAYRILKHEGSLCLFTDWRMYPHIAPALESSGFRLKNMIVWNKGSPGLGRGFRPQHEIIIHLTKGKGEFYCKRTGNVINLKRINPKTRLHQTEKPVELMAKLIQVVTPEGGIVLDPFLGSGSTAEACITSGRYFIGIEKDSHFVEVARNRVNSLLRQG